VRDHDHRDLPALPDLRQLHPQGLPQQRVQRGEGLVQQERVGVACERACQRHALLLAAGQRGGTRCTHGSQFERLEQRVDLMRFSMRQPPAPAGQPKGHVVAYRHVREEGVMLEQEAKPPLWRRHVDVCITVEQLPPADGHMTALRVQQSGHRLQRQRLSCP
jgi:hypothetical protein